MARVTLTKTRLERGENQPPTLTVTAADPLLGDQFRHNGVQTLIARNSGVVTRNLTVVGATDENGRNQDLEVPLLAGVTKILGPQQLRSDTFRQTDGYCYLDADSSDVLLGVMEP